MIYETYGESELPGKDARKRKRRISPTRPSRNSGVSQPRSVQGLQQPSVVIFFNQRTNE